MITLYDQEEVLRDYIASEKREVKEKLTKEHAQSMYKNGVSIDIIAKSLNTNLKTVEQWLGLVPQAE